MACVWRSAAASFMRSVAVRSETSVPKSIPLRRAVPFQIRSISAAVGRMESLIPLHSAVAAARLTSCIAADSSCWSSLSRGLKEDN